MIWWVYNHCLMVDEFDEVYVATDDQKIYDYCKSEDMSVIMTSGSAMTGTDRVAEVAEHVSADIYVNVQGDEPLLEPKVIRSVLEPFIDHADCQVVNCMTKIADTVELINYTVPKVIVNRDNVGVYLTRSPAPFPKGSISYCHYKQVCVYAFTPAALSFFKQYGLKYGKARVEEIEDIEILRFIENGYAVRFVEVNSKTIAVDTPNDLQKVNRVVSNQLKTHSSDLIP